jgi:hypothetical protein
MGWIYTVQGRIHWEVVVVATEIHVLAPESTIIS